MLARDGVFNMGGAFYKIRLMDWNLIAIQMIQI